MTVRIARDPRGVYYVRLSCDGTVVRTTWAHTLAWAVFQFRAERHRAGVAGDL